MLGAIAGDIFGNGSAMRTNAIRCCDIVRGTNRVSHVMGGAGFQLA